MTQTTPRSCFQNSYVDLFLSSPSFLIFFSNQTDESTSNVINMWKYLRELIITTRLLIFQIFYMLFNQLLEITKTLIQVYNIQSWLLPMFSQSGFKHLSNSGETFLSPAEVCEAYF